jgi:hypothetical protein
MVIVGYPHLTNALMKNISIDKSTTVRSVGSILISISICIHSTVIQYSMKYMICRIACFKYVVITTKTGSELRHPYVVSNLQVIPSQPA